MLTDFGVTLVLPVTVPVCGAVAEDFICRAEITVKVFIINILVFWEKAIFRFGTGVSAQQVDPPVFHFIRYGRCFVCCISNQNLDVQMLDLFIYLRKGPAVVFVAGMNAVAQDNAVNVAGGLYAVPGLLFCRCSRCPNM